MEERQARLFAIDSTDIPDFLLKIEMQNLAIELFEDRSRI